jgi:transcriptional regulator with XRE-family HTH domain
MAGKVSQHYNLKNLFGNYLRDLRKSEGFSVKDAASHLNQPTETLHKWESGKSLPPESISKILCPLYRISEPEWLDILAIATELHKSLKGSL